jgi:hypothetical protein
MMMIMIVVSIITDFLLTATERVMFGRLQAVHINPVDVVVVVVFRYSLYSRGISRHFQRRKKTRAQWMNDARPRALFTAYHDAVFVYWIDSEDER